MAIVFVFLARCQASARCARNPFPPPPHSPLTLPLTPISPLRRQYTPPERQVKSNFLYQFANRGNARDRDYARLNMAYVIAEFLGWLEVIRQEIVFITGVKANDLSLIIDA